MEGNKAEIITAEESENAQEQVQKMDNPVEPYAIAQAAKKITQKIRSLDFNEKKEAEKNGRSKEV